MGEDDWIPYSAASLASGAVALVLGALVVPSSPSASEVLAFVQMEEGRWLMASTAFFIASVTLTLGLPAVVSLLLRQRRGRVAGLAGVGVFALATIGLAGYAGLLVFFRALVLDNVITIEQVERLSRDGGLIAFMGIFVIAFYLGELILAIGFWQARTVPRWVPVLLLAHVAILPLMNLLPGWVVGVQAVLTGAGLMGIAVSANDASLAVRRPLTW